MLQQKEDEHDEPRVAGSPDQSTAPTRLDALMHYWLGQRAGTVAAKTLRADQDLLRLIPQAYLSRDAASIGPQDVMGILSGLRARGCRSCRCAATAPACRSSSAGASATG